MSFSLDTLEFDRVLNLIALEARSEPGREAVLCRRPSSDPDTCERGQAELAEMARWSLVEGRLPFAGLVIVDETLERGGLELDDSWLVLRAVRATLAVREGLLRSQEEFPLLRERGASIPDLSRLSGDVGRYFTKEGKLREDASGELRTVRTRIQAKRRAVQKTLNDVMQRHATAVQEPLITIRADRYCIPVRAERRNEIPGILHERSGSGASVFMEPLEVVELNNDLAELLGREREEIRRIARFLSEQIISHRDLILEAVRVAGSIDAVQACAISFETMEATRPRFTLEPRLHLIEGRHPLLDERLASMRRTALGEEESGRVVPTTVDLTAESRGLVISGPNAGGKTVTLKTVGLLTAMACAGLPVPARDGTLVPVTDSIHLLVGDEQNVLEHLSTFSGYLRRLERIVSTAGPRSLVLLDELGSGTNPEEGAALAAAVIEHLLECGALLMVTTHLSALQNLAIADERLINAAMEFDPATQSPTFRMITGMPGRSRALDVAERIGLPSEIVARARELVGDRFADAEALFHQMQEATATMLREREEIAQRSRELGRALAAARDTAASIERERQQLGREWREESLRLRQEVTRKLQDEIRKIRNADRERSSAPLGAIAEQVLHPVSNRLEALPGSSTELRVGDRAEHRLFRVVGEIRSIEGERVELSVRGKRMQVDRADLIPAEESASRGDAVLPAIRVAADAPAATETPQPVSELNLIGQRIDEALDASDRFLDQALLAGRSAVRLIHGHGTGRLRQAIRDHLRRHPGVKSFRPGNENEGGDGATIAQLDV